MISSPAVQIRQILRPSGRLTCSQLGENEKAIALFDDLLGGIGGVTVLRLRLDPVLDQLLQDPRFQAVLEKHEKEELRRSATARAFSAQKSACTFSQIG